MNMISFELVSFNPLPGNLIENTKDIIEKIKNSSKDIIVFPEGALTGYPLGDLVNRPVFQQDVDNAVEKILYFYASNVDNNLPAVIFGSLKNQIDSNGKPYTANTAHIIQVKNREIFHDMVEKTQLPNYNVFDDKRNFQNHIANNKPIEIRGVKVGILICEDCWFSEPAGQLSANGAEIFVSINASPFEIKQEAKFKSRRLATREIVKSTKKPLIYVNQFNALDEIVFDGDCYVQELNLKTRDSINLQYDISEKSSPLFSNKHSLVYYETNSKTFVGLLEPFNVYSYKEPIVDSKFYLLNNKSLNVINLSEEEHNVVRPLTNIKQLIEGNNLSYIYSALVVGLRNYVQRNGFTKVVLGLSGGLDSAIVATIAADALGSNNVHALLLPSRYSSDHSIADALSLCKNLNITFDKIYIEHAVNQLRQTLLQHQVSIRGTVDENLQARVRANILMSYSNANGHLLLSTGNKSELAMGYSTLGGDSMGGFNPLKDIYKTVATLLCVWRNKVENIIPENIIKKPPSAELRPGQLDTDSLLPYNILDEILYCSLELDMGSISIHKILKDQNLEISLEDIDKTIATLYRSEYKRRMGCPGVLISDLFNMSRRYPITNYYRK